MGYSTDFSGRIAIEPPLNASEIAFLNAFSDARHEVPQAGRTYANGLLNGSYYCQWLAGEDGTYIEWDGNEKFYSATEWMEYLINHFLKPNGALPTRWTTDEKYGPLLQELLLSTKFTFDHICNGVIDAQGEEPDDIWKLVVKDNVVSVVKPTITWPDEG